MLVAVLTESQSLTAVAVAAHDLGEYVRYYPRGKRYATNYMYSESLTKDTPHYKGHFSCPILIVY